MTRTPKRPAHRKRQPRAPHAPAYRRANHGLTAIAVTHNVSYASLYQQHVTLNQPLPAAIAHCTERGLTWITPGTTRLGLTRRKRTA